MGSHANPSATETGGHGNSGNRAAATGEASRPSNSHAENTPGNSPSAGETAHAPHMVSDAKVIKEYCERSGQTATQDVLKHLRTNAPRTQGLQEHVALRFGYKSNDR
ncbi:hypothetical protein FQZ97_988390 [compost metagenome]